MGTALFKIGNDDNWGMTQAPQLIRTKISRTKRDNRKGHDRVDTGNQDCEQGR